MLSIIEIKIWVMFLETGIDFLLGDTVISTDVERKYYIIDI